MIRTQFLIWKIEVQGLLVMVIIKFRKALAIALRKYILLEV